MGHGDAMTGMDDLIAEIRRAKALTPAEAERVRKAAGVSQARLAEAMGIENSTLNQWEAGKRTPRPEGMARWSEAIERLREVLDETEEQPVAFDPIDESTEVRDLFSVRVRNGLLREGIRTVGDLTDFSPQDLREIRNFGAGSVAEVERLLARAGLRLSETSRFEHQQN